MSAVTQYRAMAHAAHTFSRLSVGYLRMAQDLPLRRDRFIREAHELRAKANWYLNWARLTKSWEARLVSPLRHEAAE